MLSNKHLIVAMLVAPALAVMAWFAVDYFVAERPHAAKEGAAYTLIAKSNCRYASGRCDLENAGFKLTIRPEMLAASSMVLNLSASHALEGAVFGLVEDDLEEGRSRLTQIGDGGMTWQGILPRPTSDDAQIRVAVAAQGATWYAVIPVVFLDPDEK